MKYLHFVLALFFIFALNLPLSSEEKYCQITETELTLIQEDLMTAQNELQELQTQLSMQAELLKKSEKEARKNNIKYCCYGIVSGICTGMIIGIVARR